MLMKKVIPVLIVVILSITLVSCNKTSNVTPSKNNHSSSQNVENETTNDTTVSINEQEKVWPDLDGNPYTTHEVDGEEVYAWYDYSEVYETLDLSMYTDWGEFGMDGLMWVEKSDYTGKAIGYIDYHGNEIIPPSSEIIRAHNFNEGLAIIVFDEDVFGNGLRAIINTNGDILAKYEHNAITKYNHLNNGNIVFSSDIVVYDYDFSGQNAYLFIKSSSEFVEIPTPAWQTIETIDYSDGLLLVYSNGYVNPGAKYFDENGNCVIDLDNSNEYYQGAVLYASDFQNGEATVHFKGLDSNYYTVQIDHTGAWKTEPIKISKDETKSFSEDF